MQRTTTSLVTWGAYDFVVGAGTLPFYRLSIYVRIGAGLLFAALVIFGLGPPILLLFVLVEWLGAAWTATALRADTRRAT